MDTTLLISAAVPLIVGWILDLWLGDPVLIPHPIVGFGKLIAWGEKRLNCGRNKVFKGGLLSVLLIIGTFVVCKVILNRVESFFLGYVVLSSIGIFFCLAGKTLRTEVRWVFESLERSLEEGRTQVARIVGRDTNALSAQEVRTASLETLAENLSDGVIAPLFWYMLLGLPGMFAYKMVNTLDSMIGYRNKRYWEFGRIAAKLDDFANYIPARFTALLILFVSGNCKLFSFVKRYGRKHASPNSGYPESALAGVLDCQFGGPHNYFGEFVWKPYIGTNPRLLTTDDMKKSININLRVEVTMVFLVLLYTLVANITLINE